MIFADYISLNRVIVNLVINAIENLENNKEIIINFNNTDDNNIIETGDNGRGICLDNIEKIFDNHVNINMFNKKTVSGLGLTIVKDLVD